MFSMPLPESEFSQRTLNPIRELVDSPIITSLMAKQTKAAANGQVGKKLLSLSIGDPTVFGNLKTPDVLVDAISQAAKDFSNHGYLPSTGKLETRDAISTLYSYPDNKLSSSDVIITSGCSGALEIVFKAVVSKNTKLLVPNPGFPLYETLLKSYELPFDTYELMNAENNWECNLKDMENKIDSSTVAILVNNPSNPCGSVFSKEHLKGLIKLAEKHGLILIADEIYGEVVFEAHQFYPIASLSSKVPVISLSGIAKSLIVPGFRLGWILLYGGDNTKFIENVKAGAIKLSMLIMGANSIVQAALPKILLPGKARDQVVKFQQELARTLETNAHFLCERLQSMKTKEGHQAFETWMPQGSMYMLVKVNKNQPNDINGTNGVKRDAQGNGKHVGPNGNKKDEELSVSVWFMEKLLEEESVIVLPGSVFGNLAKEYFRVTITAPKNVLAEVCDRLETFVATHM